MTSSPVTYRDLNADKFPEPVEPLGIHRDSISASTVNAKDPHIHMGFSLIIVHNMIRRSLRSIAKHARTQQGPPSPEFIQYASYAMRVLNAHHEHEDDIFFPATQPYVDYSESSHEHEDIILLMDVVNNTINVGGETLANNVEALLEVLEEHLNKEEWLTNMYARRLPVPLIHETDKKIGAKMTKESKESGTLWLITFIATSLNAEENVLFPPMPGAVKAIITTLGGWWYKKQFAFAPY